MINSISLEEGKADKLLPLVKQYNTAVIGLCLGAEGMPNSADERLDFAGRIIALTRAAGGGRQGLHRPAGPLRVGGK